MERPVTYISFLSALRELREAEVRDLEAQRDALRSDREEMRATWRAAERHA